MCVRCYRKKEKVVKGLFCGHKEDTVEKKIETELQKIPMSCHSWGLLKGRFNEHKKCFKI